MQRFEAKGRRSVLRIPSQGVCSGASPQRTGDFALAKSARTGSSRLLGERTAKLPFLEKR